MKRLSLLAAFVLALLAPLAALASDGFVTRDLNLRTGPDVDYPRITMIEAGTPIEVLGCIDRWTWCDVAVYGERGWVSGRYVQLEYQGRRGYVSSYGYNVGIPILAFSLGTYWGQHYHDRPWYEHRDSWASSSHGNRPNYTYAYTTQYNSRGSGYRNTSTGYRDGVKVAPAQSTIQRSGTYDQSRTQTRSGSRVVTQPTQSSYSKEQQRDYPRSQSPAQTRATAPTQVERSASSSREAQQPSRSNGRGAQGPQRSEQVHTQEGHSSNARAPQGPVRGQGHAAEQTQVARQDQPAARPQEKHQPQNNGKKEKGGNNGKGGKGDNNGKGDKEDKDDKGR